MAQINWYDLLRWAHLLAGIFAFLIAPIVLTRRKGSSAHRLLGRLYFFPMSFAAATAAILAAARGNTTFIFIGVFSLYLGYSGFRSLVFKSGYVSSLLDKLTFSLGTVFFLVMLMYGVSQITVRLGVAIPLLAFGVVGLILALSDLQRLNLKRSEDSWFFGHMTGMVSSYIAAVSAFSVVNLSFLPLPVRILWPAVIGIPLLVILRRTWKRRIATAPLSSLVEIKS